MKKRDFLKYLVPLVSSVLFAGCSNNMQSVSAVSNAPNSLTELKNAAAAGAAPLVQDMSYAFRSLWVVTKTAHGSDFLLARYDFFSGAWVTVNDHWGLRCAVTFNSKCYHVNAAGELYWVDAVGAYQKIDTPIKYGQSMKALDIGAAYAEGCDKLWVLLKDRYGFRYVYTANYPLTGATASDWLKQNVSAQGTLSRVSSDPLDGNFAVGANSKGELCYWDPDGHIFSESSYKDVAICSGKWSAIKNSTLYIGNIPGNLASTGIPAKSSVAMTEIAGTTLALYIDNTDHLVIDVWDDIPVLY